MQNLFFFKFTIWILYAENIIAVFSFVSSFSKTVKSKIFSSKPAKIILNSIYTLFFKLYESNPKETLFLIKLLLEVDSMYKI